MPTARYPVPEIQSWTPALDPRASESGGLFVLAGKNYYFDSKGPKAGFGNETVGQQLNTGPHTVQSIEMVGKTLLFTSAGVFQLQWSAIDSSTIAPSIERWVQIHAWEAAAEASIGKSKWTHAYVGYTDYVCHPEYGLFEVLGDSLIEYVGTAEIELPIAIAESNGRLVIQTQLSTIYSGPFSGKDLTPELGGAGFQITAELVPGDPFMVTSFQGGFLVWTEGGMLVAEFIGGDGVFRFDRAITEQRMLNGLSWAALSDGSNALVTQQGLFKSTPAQGLQEMTPVFNEYLRSEIGDLTEFSARLEYVAESDCLYLQLMDGTSYFNKTYVLSVKMDKWGMFSENHKGICRYGSEPMNFGFVTLAGVTKRFLDAPYSISDVGELVSIDSFIELGYFRLANEARFADVEFEINEIIVSAIQTVTEEHVIIEEDWGGPDSMISYNIGFYSADEDWNRFGVSDFDENWNLPGDDEDWNDPGDDVDWGVSVAGARDFDWNLPGPDEDWGATPESGVDTSYLEDWGDFPTANQHEDWQTEQSMFNYVGYVIELHSNLDGYEAELVTHPELAMRRPKTDLWTTDSSGHHHRMVFLANQPWQKYHIKHMEITVGYSGRLA